LSIFGHVETYSIAIPLTSRVDIYSILDVEDYNAIFVDIDNAVNVDVDDVEK
jgi:hypothetical protein